MSLMHLPPFDPKLDLLLERHVDVPPARVWAAWTRPELVTRWFAPAPWQTVECTIDLRPGGMFHTVMRSPEGRQFPNAGCYLEVIENETLAFTNMLAPGFRPAKPALIDLPFTAVIALAPHGTGTLYRAMAMHGEEDIMKKHAAMGFADGWGKALDQLVALTKTM